MPLLSRAWQTLPTVVDTQGLVGDALRRTRHLRLVETYWRRSTAIMEQEMAARLLSAQGKRTDALALSKSAVSAVEPLLGYVEAMPAQGWVSITAPLSWRRQTARWLANQ